MEHNPVKTFIIFKTNRLGFRIFINMLYVIDSDFELESYGGYWGYLELFLVIIQDPSAYSFASA
jgi:hypothetical protein